MNIGDPFTTPHKTSSTDAPLCSQARPPLQSRRPDIPASPRSLARPTTMQQGMNSIAALNAGTMNREPRNVHEAVQMIQDANRMVDNGVIALMKFLHKAPENLHLLGIDEEGVDMWNQITRDGGKSYFEELSSIESESGPNKANDNTVIARRILETLNVFSRCFATRQHVENTLETDIVAGKLDALSLASNQTHNAIFPKASEFLEEITFFSQVFYMMKYPAIEWEELKLTAFLRKSLHSCPAWFPQLLSLQDENGKHNLLSKKPHELSSLLSALERLHFRTHTRCILNLQKAIDENRFQDPKGFMNTSPNKIYVDKKNTTDTKIALICFYLGLTCHLDNRHYGFKRVRTGSCFGHVKDTTSEPNSQQFTAGTTFVGAGAVGAGAGAPYAAGAASAGAASAGAASAGVASASAATADASAAAPADAADAPMNGQGAGAHGQFTVDPSIQFQWK